MKKTTMILSILSLASSLGAQSIKRQAIGAIGGSQDVDGVTIQQCVGQPYAADKNGTVSFPGFIQPLNALYVQSQLIIGSIDVYPNPSRNLVSISFSEIDSPITIEIFNQVGQIVRSEKLNSTFLYRIDCTTWISGLYVVQVKDKKGTVYQNKLIINH